MPVALRPNLVSVLSPDRTPDAHGWATAGGTLTPVGKATCSVQEVQPSSDARMSDRGGKGPYGPSERRRATVYMDRQVRVGDVLLDEGSGARWLVASARIVEDPTGGLLTCWVLDVTEYDMPLDVDVPVPDPEPDPEPPPAPVNPDLAVDNYGNGFVRIMYAPLLDDEQQHDGLSLGLALTPGPNGGTFPDLTALGAMSGAVWYDHNGALGKVQAANGTDLSVTLLARYIREGRTIDARLTLSEPPVLRIVFAHLPPVGA